MSDVDVDIVIDMNQVAALIDLPGLNPRWWAGTQAEYDALSAYDPRTLYVIHG